MYKPAYLVEGDLEQKFIQNTCPGCPVKKINLNGNNASLEAIARRVGTLGRLLHKRHSPIIVVFDRESREQTSQEIVLAFMEVLKAEAIEVPVIVGIPDRAIENWVLADYETFVSSAGLPPAAAIPICEGKNGKAMIKQLLGPNRTYVETIDGVAWLKASRPAIMMQNSPSFQRFACSLTSLSCWWLQQGHLSISNTAAGNL